MNPSDILLPKKTPTERPHGLYVACRDCLKDFRSSELVEQRCVECRVHRACADVVAELEQIIQKHRGYLRRGVRPDVERVQRLQRRLLKRIAPIVPDFRRAVEYAEKEFEAVASSHGILGQKLLEVVDAKKLITTTA